MSAESTADQTKLQFWLSGVTERQKQISEKLHEFSERITSLGHRIMAAISERGPDPDAPINAPSGVLIDRELLHELIQNRFRRDPPVNGHGSINGSKQWLRDVAIVVTLGLSAWTLKTVIDQGKDITRMQCQLSPTTCVQVVPRAQ